MEKISSKKIAAIVKDNSLSVAILEKVKSKDIEDPELSQLWSNAFLLMCRLDPVLNKIFKILKEAQNDETNGK